ncbi:NRPS-like protein biosynthetic cluster [Penicillium maclennaniae]|uniref:NRPS-like protein biosynthetic cluster n=1 Tax=Penicillium maclennaniae TaxID=1343394 RepID=UPI002541F057|nr:NRPS-like protein biosynthetic cluster [Penicillium maclennaniae]KAJ5670075.1 NRPS-like protein biosynthetic cluster [Penicillium maclennaniae]
MDQSIIKIAQSSPKSVAGLAKTIREKGIDLEEPVGILFAPGINLVVAQLAMIFARATCVAVDPSMPRMRLLGMFHDIGVKYVIVAEQDEQFLEGMSYITLSRNKERDAHSHLNLIWRFLPWTRSWIRSTAPLSSSPQALRVIIAQNIMHLTSKTPFTPLLPDDKVAHFNNPGFDLSLFEIWVALLSGATIVPIKKEVVTDASRLKDFLGSQGVTVLMLSVALMEILVFGDPSIFENLRHVLSAGDVASVKAMRAMCKPPKYLWNTYGPTECTTLTTAMLVIEEELKRDRISIGRPDLQPIRESGSRGELCISGPQLSTGYLGMSAETGERFIFMDYNALGSEETSDNGEQTIRLYRTGDYAEWRSDSDFLRLLRPLGSAEVERQLLCHEDVVSVAVIHIPSTAKNGIPLLVAFVKANKRRDLTAESIQAFVRERSPSYMVPNHIELLDELPLTINSKLDRQALKDRYMGQKKHQDHHETTHEDSKTKGASNTKPIIKELWKEILPQNVAIFLQHTRLQNLVSPVEGLTSTTETVALSIDETEVWIRDVGLVDDIELTPDWTSDGEGRVFLTGATGFVGANLLRYLLGLPTVKQVACLARRQESISGAARIQQTLKWYDLWPTSLTLIQKTMVLEGDMKKPDIGLGAERFLAHQLGICLNFCETYAAHYSSNVLGTKHVLRVAALGRQKSFHYMSSIDVWGPTGFILGTPRVLEDGPLFPHIQALRYDLGYSASQWTEEQMVRRMRDRGLPVAIYRPGYIIGDNKTGALNPNDFFSRLIVGSIQIGAFPDLQQNLECCTIDYVISAMVHIASSKSNLGRSYSLLSPDPSASITVRDTCKVTNDAGYPVIAKQLPDGPLAPLMPMFEERVRGGVNSHTPIYDSTNTADALRNRSDIRYRPLDSEILSSIISFWQRKGFYQV